MERKIKGEARNVVSNFKQNYNFSSSQGYLDRPEQDEDEDKKRPSATSTTYTVVAVVVPLLNGLDLGCGGDTEGAGLNTRKKSTISRQKALYQFSSSPSHSPVDDPRLRGCSLSNIWG